MRAMRNKIPEFQSVGVFNSQARQVSPIHSVSLKINSVSKGVIEEMAKLPAKVNIEITDKIRVRIQNGNWPKNEYECSLAVLNAIREYINFVKR